MPKRTVPPPALVQPPPTENLVGIAAVPLRYSGNGCLGLEALLDNPAFLGDRVSAAPGLRWHFRRWLYRDSCAAAHLYVSTKSRMIDYAGLDLHGRTLASRGVFAGRKMAFDRIRHWLRIGGTYESEHRKGANEIPVGQTHRCELC